GASAPTAADVYAFCCLAYELFVGRPLFVADSLPGLIGCHFAHDGNPAGLAALHDDDALAPLARILASGLAPNPRDRAPIAEIREALRALQPTLQRTAWPLAHIHEEADQEQAS